MITLAERKVLAIQYIKRALQLHKSTTENFWGRQHWRMLSGAAYIIHFATQNCDHTHA